MHFLIYGEDSFRSRQKLAAIRGRFASTRDRGGLNESRWCAGAVEMEQVAEAIFASPFLADKKFVLLEGFLDRPAAEQEQIRDWLTRKPASTIVVFFEEAAADDLAKSPLFLFLKDQPYTEEFVPLNPAQAVAVVIREAAAQGVTISRQTAQVLLARVGTDSWQISQEVAKLAAYAAGSGCGEISETTIRDLVVGQPEEEVFAFIDACVEGRTDRATRLLAALLAGGTAELQLLAMLQKQFRTIVAAQEMASRGDGDQGAVASKLGVHPFVAGKALAAARRRPAEAWRQSFERLVEIERLAKTGGGSAGSLLSIFAAPVA